MANITDTDYPLAQWIGLRQAALWAGPHLPPIEPRFAELEGYPRFIQNQPGLAFGEPDDFELAVEKGKRKVAGALMRGRLAAEGCKGIAQLGAMDGAETEDETSYDDDRCIVYEKTFTPIPPGFWYPHAIDWDASSVRPDGGRVPGTDAVEFVGVRILTQDLLRVFPDPRVPLAKPPGRSGRRGRPRIYDQHEFWVLCALELATNGLPGKKAEFSRRMSEIWSVVIGDPVPDRNWFSDRYDEIEKMRPRYEHGRKLLKGD